MSCVLTRAKRKQNDDVIDFKNFSTSKRVVPGFLAIPSVSPPVWASAQEEDASLMSLFDAVLPPDVAESSTSGYFIENKVLLRKWTNCGEGRLDEPVIQIVFRKQTGTTVLESAHGGVSGHLGVNKTYQYLLHYFYWSRIKRDVTHSL